MNNPHPNLRIVETPAWNKPAAYRPDCIELLRANARKSPSIFATLVADWRAHFVAWAILGFIAGVAATYGPVLIAGWLS